MRLRLETEVKNDLLCQIQLKNIYAAPQKLIIQCNSDILYEEMLSSTKDIISFVIPSPIEKNLVLDLEYPDAVSPLSRGNADPRKLAFAFSSITFTEIS